MIQKRLGMNTFKKKNSCTIPVENKIDTKRNQMINLILDKHTAEF